jgi:hypothetical protein
VGVGWGGVVLLRWGGVVLLSQESGEKAAELVESVVCGVRSYSIMYKKKRKKTKKKVVCGVRSTMCKY